MIRRDSSDETTSNEESDTEEEQAEEVQGNGERVWPGPRDKATRRGLGQGTHENEPGDIKQAEYVNKIGKEGRQQDAKTITCKDNNTKDTTAGDTNAKDGYKRPTEEQEKAHEGSQGGGEEQGQRVWAGR
jgi:hypothetical protein